MNKRRLSRCTGVVLLKSCFFAFYGDWRCKAHERIVAVAGFVPAISDDKSFYKKMKPVFR